MAKPVSIEVLGIDGITKLAGSLRRVSPEFPKQMRKVFTEAAKLVTKDAKAQVPKRSGAARRSIRYTTYPDRAEIKGGKPNPPYYGWLDFGGRRVGRGGGIATRPFYSEGRYIYPSYYKFRDNGDIQDLVVDGITEVCRAAGIPVD